MKNIKVKNLIQILQQADSESELKIEVFVPDINGELIDFTSSAEVRFKLQTIRTELQGLIIQGES